MYLKIEHITPISFSYLISIAFQGRDRLERNLNWKYTWGSRTDRWGELLWYWSVYYSDGM